AAIMTSHMPAKRAAAAGADRPGITLIAAGERASATVAAQARAARTSSVATRTRQPRLVTAGRSAGAASCIGSSYVRQAVQRPAYAPTFVLGITNRFPQGGPSR